MTRAEKFALAKAFHSSSMSGYPPQSQAWITQQYNAILNAVVSLFPSDDERRQFRAIVAWDNWLPDNPFRDD